MQTAHFVAKKDPESGRVFYGPARIAVQSLWNNWSDGGVMTCCARCLGGVCEMGLDTFWTRFGDGFKHLS